MFHWTRETRLLVVTVLLSVSVLLALARLRFPGREPREPISLPTRPLQQLAERASFDDLAATVSRVDERIRRTLTAFALAEHDRPPASIGLGDLVNGPPETRRAQSALGLHIGEGRYVVVTADAAHETPEGSGVTVVARDIVRGLVLVTRPGAPPPVLSTSRPALPSFLVLAEATPAGISIRPVFGPAPDPMADPRWPVPLLALSAAIASPGSLLFSLEGAFVGAVVQRPDGPALVPAETVLTEASRANAGGERGLASLGVRLQPVEGALRAAFGSDHGALVTEVEVSGPAAGRLQPGDVVQGVGDHAVRAPEDLLLHVASAPAGTAFNLDVLRGGSVQRVEVLSSASLALPAAAGPAGPVQTPLGARLRAGTRGAVVAAIEPDGPAARAGLQPGDEIWWLQGSSTATPAAVADAWRRVPAGGRVAVGVRPSSPVFVVLEKR